MRKIELLGTVSFIIPPTFSGIFHEGGRGGTANPPEIEWFLKKNALIVPNSPIHPEMKKQSLPTTISLKVGG